MSIKYRKLVGLLMVLAVVCSMVVMAVAPAVAQDAGPCDDSVSWPGLPDPGVTWSTQEASPGDVIIGNGSGFQPAAAITVTLNGLALTAAAPVVAGTDETPYDWGNGTWIGSFKIPNLPAGTYQEALDNGLVAKGGATSACLDWFRIVPKITLSPTNGGVGKSVTITGVGFTYPGTATARLFTVDDDDLAAYLITSPMPIPVNSNGTLSATFTMPQPTETDANNEYYIEVTDSADRGDTADFTLTPSIELIPTSGMPGQNFTVRGYNFPDVTGEVCIWWQAVGGVELAHEVDLDADNGFIETCEIPPAAPVGSFYVLAVSGAHGTAATTFNSGRALMIVGSQPLTLTPSSAMPGSTVTLKGYGFTPGEDLDTVFFGAFPAPITGPWEDIPDSGTVTTTIVVPALVPGTYTVIAEDTNNVVRTGTWTVAEPTISLTPAAGPVSTLVTISGSGWIPTTNSMEYSITSQVEVQIGARTVHGPVAANGRFSVQTLVPGEGTSAGPNTVLVTDEVTLSDDWWDDWGTQPPTNFSDVGVFTLTSASIELDPEQGIPGDTVDFTGSGFPAYSQIEGVEWTSPAGTMWIALVPMPQVNATGNTSGSFTVPASLAGTATVVIWDIDEETAGAGTFNVMTGAAEPAAVLAQLGTKLDMPVWSFNNTTKAWDMYDPNDLPDSKIDVFTPGAIYCIHVNAAFNLEWGIYEYPLTIGWNCIGWQG